MFAGVERGGTMTDAVASAPRGRFDFGKVFSRAVQAYRANVGVLLALSLVFGLIPQIGAAWLLGQNELFVTTDSAQTLLQAILQIIVVGLGGVAMTAGVSFAIVESNEARPPSIGDCLKRIGQKYIGLIGLSIIMNIAMGIGFILLIVPGIFLAVIWSVAVVAFVVERHPGAEALGRSDELVKGHRWAVFGLLVVLGVFMFVVGFSAAALETFLPFGLQGRILTPVVNVFLNLVNMVVIASLFVGLRDAKEGPQSRMAEVFD